MLANSLVPCLVFRLDSGSGDFLVVYPCIYLKSNVIVERQKTNFPSAFMYVMPWTSSAVWGNMYGASS